MLRDESAAVEASEIELRANAARINKHAGGRPINADRSEAGVIIHGRVDAALVRALRDLGVSTTRLIEAATRAAIESRTGGSDRIIAALIRDAAA